MDIFRGSPALSKFRVKTLLEKCQKKSLPITKISTQYIHFVHTCSPLSAQETLKLEHLLTYGNKGKNHIVQ